MPMNVSIRSNRFAEPGTYVRGGITFSAATTSVDQTVVNAANCADIVGDPNLNVAFVSGTLSVEIAALRAASERLDQMARGGPVITVARCPDDYTKALTDVATARAALVAAHG